MKKVIAILCWLSLSAQAVDLLPVFNSVIKKPDETQSVEVTSSALHVNLRNSSGTEIGASSVNPVYTTGSTAVTNPPSPTFVATAQSVAIGNNKSMLSLVNAGGSAVTIYLRSLKIKNVQTTAVTGVVAAFNLFRITGHSVGTLLTPATFDTTDSLNGSVTSRTGSTVSGESGSAMFRVLWSSDEWGVGTLDQEGYDHGIQNWADMLPPPNFMKPITLRAGEGIHVKQTTNSTAGTFDIELTFTQE